LHRGYLEGRYDRALLPTLRSLFLYRYDGTY
jgi:hypothetical protein